MRLNQYPALFLFVAAIICLVLANRLQIVAFVMLSLLFLSISIAVKFPKTRDLFTIISAIVLTLSLAEFGLFFTGASPSTLYDPTSGIRSDYYRFEEGFGHAPNTGVFTARKLSSSGDVIYDVTYTIGDDGFRKNTFDQASHTQPVHHLFGGSFAFGEGLNDEETISGYLWSDHAIAATNLGFSGYGMHQALYLIEEKELSAKQGTNILLTSPWHALRSACKPGYAAGTPFYKVENNLAVLDGTCPGDSLPARLLSRVMAGSKLVQLIKPFISDENVITDEDIERYLAIIRSINKATEINGSRLIIGYIDAREEEFKQTSYSNELIIKELTAIADTVVDLTLAEKTEELEASFLIHELDQHPSAFANQSRANILMRVLY